MSDLNTARTVAVLRNGVPLNVRQAHELHARERKERIITIGNRVVLCANTLWNMVERMTTKMNTRNLAAVAMI